ncbi:MAG: alpha-mannosidase [Candidatus Dormibacteria bacterium]
MSPHRRPHVQTALTSLRTRADAVRSWPDLSWERLAGPGPDTVRMHRGRLDADVLAAGEQTVLEWPAVVPATLDGVALAGDPLEVTIESLHPLEVHHEGACVLDARRVAPGPALITAIPALRDGDNGRLRLTVHAPEHELGWQWLNIGLTTPSRRSRFELIDTIWARLALAEAVASDAEAERCVDDAVRALGALDAEPTTAWWERAAGAVRDSLARLADEVAAMRLHLIGHSHIDMNWQWTWSDTSEVVLRDLASAASILDEDAEMTFTHSQPAAYEVVRSRDPALFARIAAHVRGGRWEPATMQWVEGDSNLASGEATVRQLLEGVRWTRTHLGVSPTVHLAPDTFGHAGNLPQLTAAAGATVYYHHRCNPGGPRMWPAYWWQGDDGTRLFACSTFSYNGDLAPSALALSALDARAAGLHTALHFHGVGNHGGGPARQAIAMAHRLQREPGLPTLVFSTLARYRDEVVASGVSLPVHRGESATIFEGCYTTHADVKAHNRRGENALATAEALHVLAGGAGAAGVDSAWQRVLFHQFHDILDGSAIHEAYAQTAEDADAVELTASRVAGAAMRVLAGGAGTGTAVVVNPTGDDRSEVVVAPLDAARGAWIEAEDASRTPAQACDGGVCFRATVPAFGRAVYRLSAGVAAEPMPVRTALSPAEEQRLTLTAVAFPVGEGHPYIRVDTGVFDVHVRRDCGVITSLVDRRNGRELVANAMRRAADYLDSARSDLAVNVLQLVDEHPHQMSSWHLDEVWRESSLLRGAATEVVEHGPVRTVLRTVHSVRDSTITQSMTFAAGVPRIDVSLEVDWGEVGGPECGVPGLAVAATVAAATDAWFETPYAASRRPANGQEVPALRWASVSGPDCGMAILNDSKHGYNALGSRLRLTLLRSAYDPDPRSDAGRQMIRYSLVPFCGDPFSAGVPALAAGFNQPLVVAPGSHADAPATPSWQPRLDPGSARITALKAAHDGSGEVVVRVAETAGAPATAVLRGLPGGAAVREASVIEDAGSALCIDGDGAVRLELRPWQVRTLRVG